MTVTLVAAGDSVSTLIEKTNSTSVEWNVPLPKLALVNLIRSLLVDPDARQVETAPVLAERMRDGIRVHVGSANFLINYRDVFPLVLVE